MVNKRGHYSAGVPSLHMLHGHSVHETSETFFVRNPLFPVHNAWTWAQFDHLAAPRGFRSSVHRSWNNTETMLFGVCFAFLMCKVLHDIHKREHYSARGTAVHILDVGHGNFVICGLCVTLLTAISRNSISCFQVIFCRQKQMTKKPCFQTCFLLSCSRVI